MGAGIAVAVGTVGWVVVRSRRSAQEPPVLLLDAKHQQAAAFLNALETELRSLGARAISRDSSLQAFGQRLMPLRNGIYALLAAGVNEGGQIAVVAEIREAAWHTTLWVQRRSVSPQDLAGGAKLWFSSLAATLASASRGVFAPRLRANPRAIRLYEEVMEPLRLAGWLYPPAESGPLPTLPPPEAQRMAGQLRQAVEADPKFAIARGRLAWVLAHQGLFPDAEEQARETLIQDERVWAAVFAMGLVRAAARDEERACQAFGRCLELAPFQLQAASHLPRNCAAARPLLAELRAIFSGHVQLAESPHLP